MKVEIYFDVYGYEKESSQIFPTTNPGSKPMGVKRYCVVTEIPDPQCADLIIEAIAEEVKE